MERADSDPTLPGLAKIQNLGKPPTEVYSNPNLIMMQSMTSGKHLLTQNQPLGNSRFYTKIEAMTGQRREPKPRGRPAKR